jgi:hypothetical protein
LVFRTFGAPAELRDMPMKSGKDICIFVERNRRSAEQRQGFLALSQVIGIRSWKLGPRKPVLVAFPNSSQIPESQSTELGAAFRVPAIVARTPRLCVPRDPQ